MVQLEKEQLYQRARQDHDEREASRRRAITRFNGHSQALYAEPGRLLIDVTHAGFKFDVDMPEGGLLGVRF